MKWVKKRMGAPEHPVLTEFAGRGVLSSLLTIEHKLGNLSRRIHDEGTGEGVFPAYQRGRVSGLLLACKVYQLLYIFLCPLIGVSFFFYLTTVHAF